MVGAALQDRRALLNGLIAAAVGAVVGSLVSLAAHDWSFAGLGAALSFGGSIGYSAKEIALRRRRTEQAE